MAQRKPPAKRRQALGRGLSALITQEEDAPTPGVAELEIDAIATGAHQPREQFDARSLEELAASIRQYGILQPLVVAPAGRGWQLIAGERRLRAARLAGLSTVPAVVRELDAVHQLELALIENIQRADLNPIEEARAYLQLLETLELSQGVLAKRVGKSRAYLANKLRLLNLPEPAQELLVAGAFSEGHARALLPLASDPDALLEAARQAADGHMNVRDVEALATRHKRNRTAAARRHLDPDWEAVRTRLEQTLHTPVRLAPRRRGGGTLTIRFYDNTQIDDFMRRLDVDLDRG